MEAVQDEASVPEAFKFSRDWRWFKNRLADLALLDAAVELSREGYLDCLAVPVGGRRRGGSIPFSDLLDALNALRALSTHWGKFPHPRLEIIDDEETSQSYDVRWGDFEPEPLDEDEATPERLAEKWREMGRFYGYSEAAIEKYVREARDD